MSEGEAIGREGEAIGGGDEEKQAKKKPIKGRLNAHEKEWLKFNAPKLTVKEMAEKVGRSEGSVRRFLDEHFSPGELTTAEDREETIKVVIKEDLREGPEWKRLKKEFSPNELKDFEHSYVGLAAQFGDDLLASERLQLMEVVKLGILMSRNLQARLKCREDIDRLEEGVNESARNLGEDLEARRIHADLERTLVAARSAEGFKTKEYTDLLQRSDALMKTLKATRDQRIKDVVSGKATFLGMVKQLQQEEARTQAGREMGLMSLAAEKEYERLGRPHRYADGMIDQPILSSETVGWDDKSETKPEGELDGELEHEQSDGPESEAEGPG